MTIHYQRITLDIRVNGVLIRDAVSVSTSAGFEQINLEASVTEAELTSGIKEGDTLEIWASNGSEDGHIFSGEIVDLDRSYAATKGTIKGRDLLSRTRYDWAGDDVEETNIDSAALVRHLLEIMGIPSSAAHIEGSSTWTIGVIDPFVLTKGDNVYSKIEEIDFFEGYRTFSLPTGVIVRLPVNIITGASVAMEFEKGVQILADATWARGISEIKNEVVIDGNEYEGLEISSLNIGEIKAANGFIPNPPGFVTLREQSTLIEDDQLAYDFGARMLTNLNRRPESIRFRVPFTPKPQPNMLVRVIHADLVGGSVKGFIKNVAHDISSNGGFTTIDIIGGSLSLPVNRDPVAVFDYQLFKETEDGIGSYYIAYCDGSLSYDPDGTIASYAWAISGGGATPSSGSAATFTTVLDGTATSIDLSLTVTDNEGLTNTLSRTIPILESKTFIEDKYLAWGKASVSIDGEKTWKDATPASGNATCLMPIAPAWGQVWGTTAGHLYATFDNLATPLVDLGAPHGVVAATAVWVHETDPTRLWVGFNDGKVYFGAIDLTLHTCAFTLQGTIPEGPIREIRESYGTLGELRATAGTSYYYSSNSGASWVVVHTFDTAWRMAAGFDTNLASGLNDAAPIYDEDATPPTVPMGVTHIRGISFGWRDQELYAADNAANLYLSNDPTTFNLALHADTTTAIVNHMIRSGNERRAVYMAVGDGTGDNGFVKWIPDTLTPTYFRKTSSNAGLMVAYGAAHLPPINVDLLTVRGNVAGSHNIWYYNHITAAWTSIDGDLPAGKDWLGIVANPLDPLNEWIIWRSDAAYRTTNAGTNWTLLTGIGTLAFAFDADTTPHKSYHYKQIEFCPTVTHQWVAIGYILSSTAVQTTAFITVGLNNAAVGDAYWLVDRIGLNGMLGRPESVAWLNDDRYVVYTSTLPLGNGPPPVGAALTEFSALATSGEYIGEVTRGTGTYFAPNHPPLTRIIDALDTGFVAGICIQNFSSGFELWTVGDVYVSQSTPQPASSLLNLSSANSLSSVALTTTAIYVAVGDGIYEIATTDPTSSTLVAQSGLDVTFIRAEHTQRTGLAATIKVGGSITKLAVFSGTEWTEVNAPSGTTALADWVEAIAIV